MAKAVQTIHFSAGLYRPGGIHRGASWTFLRVPEEASLALPTRSMVSVEGTFNGHSFFVTLEPDGEGGHWLRAESELTHAADAKVGDLVEVVVKPMEHEPEPRVPDDLQLALEAAPDTAMATWLSTTPLARRDWIYWIVTGKKAETRAKRIGVAISKMTAGSRRPCCFDRSGMYDKSLSCPVADVESAP